MSKFRAIKATAYFSMTRKYISMMKKLSSSVKTCDNYEEYKQYKEDTKRYFYESLDNNEIDAFMRSSYADGWRMFHDLEKETKQW